MRDRGDLTVEAGVHQLTGRIADAFGIHDRGVVREGLAGDVVVFALDELAYRPDRFVTDLPGGAPAPHPPARRLPARPSVGGVVTQEGGVATGARPAGPLDAG